MSSALLLFLDFDGVLHPLGCEESLLFSHRVRFEALMREHPSVRIVISSAWQEAHALEALQAMFSPDIAARIIGVTGIAHPEGAPSSRYERIRAFLSHIGEAHVRWIAVDDAAHEFPPDCVELLLCDSERGLDEQTLERLRKRLR